ncbi:sensor histidine kinase [Peterkaempfera griseoplana]|uniref:sensor histidine kinase n=1 Tax=Peterkaempfera griseoplana TaxID=66896 RepID=UPI0006E2706D|nr:sensor histidine kinase [Peterkaempfera griseoplana]
MTWSLPAGVRLVTEAAGSLLLVASLVLEVTDQPLQSELVLSLAAAILFFTAASMSTMARRTWLAIVGGISLMLAVAGLARITEEPIVNALHVAPLMLIAYAASTGRRATLRERQLERERSRARRDGEERERRRWARELHDDTLQELGAVQVVLASAAAGGQPSAMREAIDQARSLVSNQIASLRHLIAELRPAVLDQLGLRPAIEALCRRVSETFGVRVDFRVAADWDSFAGRLTPQAQVHVYRIVQEAVSNAVKHADPQRLLVELHADGRAVTASVSDDGTGMPPGLGGSKPSSTGMGLWDMRERADLLDAELRISSAVGAGTRVVLRVPYGRGVEA